MTDIYPSVSVDVTETLVKIDGPDRIKVVTVGRQGPPGPRGAAGPAGGGIVWNNLIDETSQLADVNSGYICNNNSAIIVITLPTTSVVGDVVAVVGIGIGGWEILQNSGQTIHFGNKNCTLGVDGSLNSTDHRDCVELVCVTADTDWAVRSSVGNISLT